MSNDEKTPFNITVLIGPDEHLVYTMIFYQDANGDIRVLDKVPANVELAPGQLGRLLEEHARMVTTDERITAELDEILGEEQ